MQMTSASVPSSKTILLSSAEQRAFAWRLNLALTAAAALALSLILKVLEPDQKAAAQLLAASAALLAGIPALIAAWKSLRYPDLHGITDQLIALAFIAAWASGDLVTAALLPLIMMIGHILEERSLLGSQEAIRALTNLTEKTARRIEPTGDISEVNVDDLRADDVIEVRAGDRIPADGDVLAGTSSMDTASITGEFCASGCHDWIKSIWWVDKSGRRPVDQDFSRRKSYNSGTRYCTDATSRTHQACNNKVTGAICKRLSRFGIDYIIFGMVSHGQCV